MFAPQLAPPLSLTVEVRQVVRNATGALSQNEDRILICSVSVADLLLTTKDGLTQSRCHSKSAMKCVALQRKARLRH